MVLTVILNVPELTLGINVQSGTITMERMDEQIDGREGWRADVRTNGRNRNWHHDRSLVTTTTSTIIILIFLMKLD